MTVGDVDSGHWDITLYTPTISAHGNRADRARLGGIWCEHFFNR